MAETQSTTRNDELLSPDFMRQLDRIDILSRKMLMGRMQGERRSKKRGQSVEFADYRNYVVGDDLRFIDWNLYARLDKLFLRLFLEEEDLSVSIVLDVTASMNYGEPNKLAFAKKLAAALGYTGLVHYNRVNFYTFTDAVHDQARGLRGRRPIPRMLEFLDKQQPPKEGEKSGHLANALRRVALTQREPGVIVVVSDFMDKGDLNDALRYLGEPKHDVYAVQLLSPQEVDPSKGQIVGDLRLRDVEDGDIAEVSVSAPLLNRYKANLQAYCQHVRATCLKRQIAYMISETDVSLESLVLKYLRQRGLVG
jgi:uncharacterized protein (DUF58 family)